eukprot:239469-Amphidinium_carterae.2
MHYYSEKASHCVMCSSGALPLGGASCATGSCWHLVLFVRPAPGLCWLGALLFSFRFSRVPEHIGCHKGIVSLDERSYMATK